jgi:hypothetical protein
MKQMLFTGFLGCVLTLSITLGLINLFWLEDLDSTTIQLQCELDSLKIEYLKLEIYELRETINKN